MGSCKVAKCTEIGNVSPLFTYSIGLSTQSSVVGTHISGSQDVQRLHSMFAYRVLLNCNRRSAVGRPLVRITWRSRIRNINRKKFILEVKFPISDFHLLRKPITRLSQGGGNDLSQANGPRSTEHRLYGSLKKITEDGVQYSFVHEIAFLGRL